MPRYAVRVAMVAIAVAVSGSVAPLAGAPTSGAVTGSCMPSIRMSLVEGVVDRVHYMAQASDLPGCDMAQYAIASTGGELDPGEMVEGDVTVGCAKSVTGTIQEVDGQGSDQDTVTTGFLAPYAPTAPSLVQATTTSLRAAWAADFDACHPIDSFVLQSNSGASLAVIDPSGTLTGLAPSTVYALTAVAVNAKGRTAGPATSMRTSAVAVTKPTVPNSLSASGVQPTSARLTWSVPSSAGTSPVTGYAVTVNGAALGTVAALARELTGLAPNTSYTATVAAVSAAGTGPSASVTFRTAVLPVAPTPTSKPTVAPAPAPAPTPATPVLAAQTITLQTTGPAWRSGKAHVVGAKTTSAGTPVTWKARGAGVKSVKRTTKAGQAALVITLKPGRKSARVTITATAPTTATHAAVTSSTQVTLKR